MKTGLLKNKDAFQLIAGTALAQAIPFLFSPLLSRLYSPSEYALLGIMLAASNVLVEFTNLKYERSIVLEENLGQSKNILFACFIFSGLVALLTYLLFLLFQEKISELGIHSQIQELVVILPLMVFSMGIVVASNFWFQRKKEFFRMTANKLVQMIGITALSILLGFMAVQNGLAVAYSCGWMLVLLFSVYQLWKTQVRYADFDWKKLRVALRKFAYFPKLSLFPSVFHILALSLPFFMVPKIFGEDIGGQFNMCKQMLVVPLSFISAGFTQIYFRKLAENHQEGKSIAPLLWLMFKPLFFFAFIAFVLVFFFGTHIFVFVLGEKWEQAGEFSQLYIVAAVLQYFSISLMIVLPVLNKVKQESFFKGMYFLAVAALFFIKFRDETQFLRWYTLIESLIFCGLIAYSLYAVKNFENKIKNEFH